MGKLGQSRKKQTPKEKVSAAINSSAEDITAEDTTEKTTDDTVQEEIVEPKKKVVKTPKAKKTKADSTTTDDTTSSTVDSDDDFAVDPSKLDDKFKFEGGGSVDSNPLNIPLAEETHDEGQTIKKMGGDSGNKNDLFEETQTKTDGGKKEKITMEQAFSDPKHEEEEKVVDDVPPPDANTKDLFDESDSTPTGEDGHELPKGFVEWSAKKQADFIVNTEVALFEGFSKNKAKINLFDLKQRLMKYNIPATAKAEIIMQVSDFNDQIEDHLKIENDMIKNLKSGWEAVLSQHSNISKHLTPEAALAITHGLVIWKLWAATKELKDYGKNMLIEIKDFLKPYEQAAQQQAEAKTKQADQKNNAA